jgi:hypothetical protein
MTRMMSAFGTEVFMRRLFVAAGVVLLMVPNMISAQARVERNVVYGIQWIMKPKTAWTRQGSVAVWLSRFPSRQVPCHPRIPAPQPTPMLTATIATAT